VLKTSAVVEPSSIEVSFCAFVDGFPPLFLYVAMVVLLLRFKNIIFIRKKKANYLLFFNNLQHLFKALTRRYL
jgi:hypothetical protein